MCFNSFCKSCRLLRRIVKHNIEKDSCAFICLKVILFVLAPSIFIALVCVYPKKGFLKVAAVLYNTFAAAVAVRLFCLPLRKAMAEAAEIASVDRSRADLEASSDITSVYEIVVTPEGASWIRYPHWPPRQSNVRLSGPGSLERMLNPNESLSSQPGTHSASAELSAIRNVEDSDVESNLLPQVTHRSRHPSRLSEEQPIPSSHVVTEAEVYRSYSEENE